MGAENSFVEKQQQQIDLLTKTAEKRYTELLQKNPEIIQRIAQKHIASYLGITAQSLSRIRNSKWEFVFYHRVIFCQNPYSTFALSFKNKIKNDESNCSSIV